ncbi:MAG: hypothetical protein TREMPRED_002916 [Tremellales sp. Tagirdzhanova-0007]|nr:MAG: hypothetical protein TREMPRED_002916 [Tremellales sp. Tagirdzhanova-0007]
MSLEEANMILNVKKEESMEVIQRHYDEIFSANGPPPEPPRPPATSGVKKPSPKPIYSHYMQSKVYRALERIKAERLDLGEGGGMTTPTSAAEGSAPVTGAAPGSQ